MRVELATLECDGAAVAGDGVNAFHRSGGRFYPEGRPSTCVGKGPRARKPERLGLASQVAASGFQ